MSKYIKFPKEVKLCSFIVPCESYLQQNKLYDLLTKRFQELSVHSYTNNCFTYTFIDVIKKKIDKDTADVSIKMDMFCNINNRYDKDDVLHMKRVIERICGFEILMESKNDKVLGLFTVNVQEENDIIIQNSLTTF
jgi:hypothetical protein